MDNPEHYQTFYASDAAEGAVGEAFGNLQTWSDGMFQGRPAMPGSFKALATMLLSDASEVLNLDDARNLLDRELRPSSVVIRDRPKTQAWALRIYGEQAWAGVRWWSYYNPAWGSHGIWDRGALELVTVAPLNRAHPAVLAAVQALSRTWS